MQKRYTINLARDNYFFSAAHFLIFDEQNREPLHGHNYQVSLKLTAEKLINGMVLDFTIAEKALLEVIATLDHKTLIPENCPYLEHKINSDNINLNLSNGEFFSLPLKDSLLLPVSHISTEILAHHLTEQFCECLPNMKNLQIIQIELEIAETAGQTASYQWNARGNL